MIILRKGDCNTTTTKKQNFIILLSGIMLYRLEEATVHNGMHLFFWTFSVSFFSLWTAQVLPMICCTLVFQLLRPSCLHCQKSFCRTWWCSITPAKTNEESTVCTWHSNFQTFWLFEGLQPVIRTSNSPSSSS